MAKYLMSIVNYQVFKFDFGDSVFDFDQNIVSAEIVDANFADLRAYRLVRSVIFAKSKICVGRGAEVQFDNVLCGADIERVFVSVRAVNDNNFNLVIHKIQVAKYHT